MPAGMAEAAAASTLGQLVRQVRAALEKGGTPDAALEARLIVEHATGASRTDLVTDPERPVTAAQMQAVASMLERRSAGEPVHRILGAREFYGLRLALSSGTLEPRPDTEALVDLALPFVRATADRHGNCLILDLGTGTGAVALALLKEEKRARAVATDISPAALATAVANADINGVAARFTGMRSDWFETVDGSFHVIVSNPPYIATNEIALLSREVREHDPRAALDGGSDGLDAYRAIAGAVAGHLAEDGVVAVEIGIDQESDVEAIFAGHGFTVAGRAKDLGGVLRSIAFTRC